MNEFIDQLPEDVKRDLLNRLRRVEGQIRGLQRMVEEDRGCEEILPQLNAVISATRQVGLMVAACTASQRMKQAVQEGLDPEAVAAELTRMLTRLG